MRLRRTVLAAAAALSAPLLATAGTGPAGATAAPRTAAAGRQAASVPPPVASGTLAIAGTLRDGSVVHAAGLRWHPGKLAKRDRLLSFEVAYYWSSCESGRCRAAADSTVTPYAARRYIVGHADTGRLLELEETATEVVETDPSHFGQGPVSASESVTTSSAVAAYPAAAAPRTEFVDGTPEPKTASTEEYFEVDPPHYAASEGRPAVAYRIDEGGWHSMPPDDVFYTGVLGLGHHEVEVSVEDRGGETVARFGWRVVPMPAPLACQPRQGEKACWLPPHLASNGKPMRWDWQIGAVAPVQRTGKAAVDFYDIDGFLTTAAEVKAIHATWQAATLPHPRVACYLDVAWENYRPDASPVGHGGLFPPATLGKIYFGYPDERWLDFRQLDALKPMLEERIKMCAEKGFDAVEIDDIDSFDPPSTTGFHLTPGDAENFLAFVFNLIHENHMAALWKNTPDLTWWGEAYTDGAVVEECYVGRQCFASQFAGDSQYGITCTALSGATPCGWDDFSTAGKWVGEAEYLQDHFVCPPNAGCTNGPHQRRFATYCKAVYSPPDGYSAVLFTVDLNAKVFYPCPSGL